MECNLYLTFNNNDQEYIDVLKASISYSNYKYIPQIKLTTNTFDIKLLQPQYNTVQLYMKYEEFKLPYYKLISDSYILSNNVNLNNNSYIDITSIGYYTNSTPILRGFYGTIYDILSISLYYTVNPSRIKISDDILTSELNIKTYVKLNNKKIHELLIELNKLLISKFNKFLYLSLENEIKISENKYVEEATYNINTNNINGVIIKTNNDN